MSVSQAPLFELNFEKAAPENPQAEKPAEERLESLHGFDPTPAVVAVEVDDASATLILAEGEARRRESRPFRPWLLAGAALSRQQALPAVQRGDWTRLEGEGLGWLIEFEDWRGFHEAREALQQSAVPHLAYRSRTRQFLMRSGVTLFKGLELNDIRRLQFDLETTSLYADRPDSRILMIAVSDNRGGEWLLEDEDEARLIHRFVELVRERDPDVLEGHNLYSFDLPYLVERAAACGVRPALGRNGSDPVLGATRQAPVGGMTRPYRHAAVWGRHLIDTLLGVQRFDVARGELETYGLKAVCIHYGLADSDRVYLDASRMAELIREDPESVRRYALQDVHETRRLADLVMPAEFYSTQLLPESYGAVAVGGSGEKINSLLIREYLHRGHAVPLANPPRACPGGYTEVRRTGVLRGVVKADVESLYPSIMLQYGIRPSGDSLGVFLPLLRELTQRRLLAKQKAREGGPEAAYWDGLQSSFKILINSFYGYLGAPFHFNDFEAAAQITTTGQRLVQQVAAEIEQSGGQVIEIDTDGVYFIPPPQVQGADAEAAYVAQTGRCLPQGIRLAYDGSYPVMVSLKIKNYVLVDGSGRKIYRGAALRSRADEPLGRNFLAAAIDCLIEGDCSALNRLYLDLAQRIEAGEVPVEELARRERITEKTITSTAGRRLRELRGGVKVGDRVLVYERADGSLGRVEDYAGDEDRLAYLERLHRFALRLADALPEKEMEKLCPPPDRRRFMARRHGQMELF